MELKTEKLGLKLFFDRFVAKLSYFHIFLSKCGKSNALIVKHKTKEHQRKRPSKAEKRSATSFKSNCSVDVLIKWKKCLKTERCSPCL